MKIFISQPFSDYTVEEINEINKLIICKIKDKDYEIIENNVRPTYESNPLIGLGESISLMSKADKVYIAFVDNQPLSKGCMIEQEVCKLYKIPYEYIFINYKKGEV